MHFLKSQRRIDEFHQLQCGDADDAGIRPRLAHELLAIQAGGKEHLRFTHTDYKNYSIRWSKPSWGTNSIWS